MCVGVIFDAQQFFQKLKIALIPSFIILGFQVVTLAIWTDQWDLFSDDMDQDAMADGGLDDMMEAELANMAERDAEVEMVMAEFDAGDAGGMDNAD